jgi:aryl-alcohol dehydrogenase-like predicted oxidoreductase
MMPLCADRGIGVIPWSPLARGRLARPWDRRSATQRAATDEFGKTLYVRTEDADRVVVERVEAIAKARGVPMARVALAWVLSKPFVTAPIVGVTKMAQLEDAVAAVELKLSEDELKRLEEPYAPHPVLGF